MKLNKKICRKCFKLHNIKWKISNEEIWKERSEIMCPRIVYWKNGPFTSIFKVPENCPYILEILMRQE